MSKLGLKMRVEGEAGGLPGAAPPSGGKKALRLLRKIGVALVGGTVVVLGLVLVVLPGPAIVVVPFGVAILATEFLWAERLRLRIRTLIARSLDRLRRSSRPRLAPLLPEGSGPHAPAPREP